MTISFLPEKDNKEQFHNVVFVQKLKRFRKQNN